MPYKIVKRKCKQSDGKSGSYVVSKKKKNNKLEKKSCHKTKAKALGSIGARYSESTYKESAIREFIREVLIESKEDRASSLPDFFYKPLEDDIKGSAFWTYENTPDDSDMINIRGEWHNQTPSATVLGRTIENFFSSQGIPLTVIVRTAEPEFNEKLKLPVNKDHFLYPNRLVVGGSQGISKKGRFVMYLNMVPVSEDFQDNDVNPDDISRIVGNIIRHEYIHARQIEKRRKNQKISRLAAKDRYEQEGEIPDSSNREDYLGSKIEIDAYAHEFAEFLLQNYGEEKSLDILRGKVPIDSVDLPDQFEEYLENVSGEKSTRKLMGKIYNHILDLTKRKIYESLSGYHPEESYKKASVKNLYLDKDTMHGGWPEGEYEPPVNKQISDWLKSMSLMEDEKESEDDDR